LAQQYPASVQDNIIAAAKNSFLQGDEWAYLAGIVAVLVGAVLVFFLFPKRDAEKRLLAEYAAEDAGEAPAPPSVEGSREAIPSTAPAAGEPSAPDRSPG
jgi:MFS transporter, DHA2 family, multidrug resistance protein